MAKTIILPQGVCADRIDLDVENGVIKTVRFEGGCDGNGKALSRLLAGMKAKKAAEILKGVDCDGKGTSCADQLSRGISEILKTDMASNA